MKKISTKICALVMAFALCLSMSSVAFAAEVDTTVPADQSEAEVAQNGARAKTLLKQMNITAGPLSTRSLSATVSGYSHYEIQFRYTSGTGAVVSFSVVPPSGVRHAVDTMYTIPANSTMRTMSGFPDSGTYTFELSNLYSSNPTANIFVAIFGY